MMNTCARSEKCAWDIRKKLKQWELTSPQIEEIIQQLREQKFIDDERYARAFTKDKSRFNAWGKTKITYHLRSKGIAPDVIAEALHEIREEDYKDRLEQILEAKIRSLQPIDDKYKAKAKLVRYAASKGFEPELIYSTIDSLMSQ